MALRILADSKHVIGPNIDTTNPDAAKWWWEAIRDRYIKPDGFDYLWLDETEPDIDPGKGRVLRWIRPRAITTSIPSSTLLLYTRAPGATLETAAGS